MVVKVNIEQFRGRSIARFRLCEAWLAGSLTNVEFMNQTTQAGPCFSLQEGTLDTVLELSREFEHALGCTHYIHTAIEEMREEGINDNPASAVRAVYFARQVEVMQHVLALNSCVPAR